MTNNKKPRRRRGNTKPTEIPSKKKETKPKYKYDPWYLEKPERQYYDDNFFIPYFQALEPKIPADYKDPIFEEEFGILTTPTPDWKNASSQNLNIPALFNFYGKKILPEFEQKGLLAAILIPSGTGNMNLNSAVSFATMYKPRHRIHTVQGHNIGILRNKLVDMALQHTDCSHIFFLDSDVVVPPYGLIRLMRRDLDIVSGIYMMKSPPYVPLTIMRPSRPDGERKFNYYFEITAELLNKVVPCDGTGAGCLLIKREVLEKMGPPWFQVSPREHGLSAIGEDLFFFDKAADCGYQPMLDLSVQCEHNIGGTAYPRIFFEGLSGPGPKSKQMINVWNKNAVLWAEKLPLYKSKEELERERKQKEELTVLPISPTDGNTSIPVGVEKEELTGDARSVKK